MTAHRFCCPYFHIPQGRGSVRGKPLRVSPLAFNHPPAGDRFCAAKSPLQKNTTTQRVVVFFWCERWDLNPHDLTDTSTSSLPVCRFQHPRKSACLLYQIILHLSSTKIYIFVFYFPLTLLWCFIYLQ